jgi:hypothetical protein
MFEVIDKKRENKIVSLATFVENSHSPDWRVNGQHGNERRQLRVEPRDRAKANPVHRR